MALLLVLVSIPFFVSVIGIPAGIGFFLMAGGLAAVAVGGAKVRCPACGKDNYVMSGKDGLNCKGCKNRIVVDWH
jgi:hypothetical protein